MPDDMEALNARNYQHAFSIQQQCHFNPWSEKVFADCLTAPYFAFQLLQNKQCCGYYVGMDVVGEATLMDIGVAEKYRGQGFGRRLLQHFIGHCKQKDCSEIWLEVRASNTAAVQLYKNLKFELIEIRKEYYPSEQGREDALIMKKSLT